MTSATVALLSSARKTSAHYIAFAAAHTTMATAAPAPKSSPTTATGRETLDARRRGRFPVFSARRNSRNSLDPEDGQRDRGCTIEPDGATSTAFGSMPLT
jgi:hypothetical protein